MIYLYFVFIYFCSSIFILTKNITLLYYFFIYIFSNHTQHKIIFFYNNVLQIPYIYFIMILNILFIFYLVINSLNVYYFSTPFLFSFEKRVLKFKISIYFLINIMLFIILVYFCIPKIINYLYVYNINNELIDIKIYNYFNLYIINLFKFLIILWVFFLIIFLPVLPLFLKFKKYSYFLIILLISLYGPPEILIQLTIFIFILSLYELLTYIIILISNIEKFFNK